jgi:hypothetical protein
METKTWCVGFINTVTVNYLLRWGPKVRILALLSFAKALLTSYGRELVAQSFIKYSYTETQR